MAKPKSNIEARVLSEIELYGVKHPANSVVVISSELAEAYKDSLDSSADAVAYAKENGAVAVEVVEDQEAEED